MARKNDHVSMKKLGTLGNKIKGTQMQDLPADGAEIMQTQGSGTDETTIKMQETSSQTSAVLQGKNSASAGLKDGYRRFTITTRGDLIDKFKDYAWTARLKEKEAVTQMFEEWLADKEIMKRPGR